MGPTGRCGVRARHADAERSRGALGATGARGAGQGRAGRGRGTRGIAGARGLGSQPGQGCAIGALSLFLTRFDSVLFLSQFLDTVHEHCSPQKIFGIFFY